VQPDNDKADCVVKVKNAAAGKEAGTVDAKSFVECTKSWPRLVLTTKLFEVSDKGKLHLMDKRSLGFVGQPAERHQSALTLKCGGLDVQDRTVRVRVFALAQSGTNTPFTATVETQQRIHC
ncbi:MAG TPA: hypothetical protein VMT88_05065, partial [Actinomycetes bacterium]|nr:hypothetical protein [Actinomycetes bacterium]